MNGNTELNRALKYVPVVVVLLAVFLFIQSMVAFKEYRYVGATDSHTVTVSGEGEVFAVPDIATFTFSITEEADDVATAQERVTERMDNALERLAAEGVEERDIRTTGYNVYPKYEFERVICTEFRCPPSNQTLSGYEVTQSISVKVREVSKAGDLIGILGSLNVTNVSGVSFTIDDEDAIVREARKQAIEDAEEKARELARDLDVKLVRIVSFNESGGDVPVYARMESLQMAGSADAVKAPSPALPIGENRVVSNVSITYEIR